MKCFVGDPDYEEIIKPTECEYNDHCYYSKNGLEHFPEKTCHDSINGWICTRKKGHKGLHESVNYHGHCLARWDNTLKIAWEL